MAANAWERAQEAIAHASQRATERDEDVITPDDAVSPFDASTTTMLPHAIAAGRRGVDPDRTQRLPQDRGRPVDRRPRGDGNGPGDPEDEDPVTVRLGAQRAHPGTSPFPASPFPDEEPGEDGHAGREATAAPRRSWWRRLFGR